MTLEQFFAVIDVGRAVVSLGILVIGFLSNKLAQRAICKVFRIKKLNETVQMLLQQTAKWVILALSVTIALSNLGIDLGALVTTLGVGGIAISFAVKDIIANIISGVLLLLHQPFKVNDYIELRKENVAGIIKKIDLRYTHLQDAESHILIPNSLIYINTVVLKPAKKSTPKNLDSKEPKAP